MSKTEDKRRFIFERSLGKLTDSGLIKSQKDVYICPVCLKPHKDMLEADPLTLEGAPPKSLGGKANTLTCKSCNSSAGHEIDAHLIERLREIDSASFVPGTETLVRVRFNGEILQGKISVAVDGTLSMFHAIARNHPQKLEGAMTDLKSGMPIDIDFLKSRVIPEKLEYALLKTAYVMLFERFGYAFVLDKCYDIVGRFKPEGGIKPL